MIVVAVGSKEHGASTGEGFLPASNHSGVLRGEFSTREKGQACGMPLPYKIFSSENSSSHRTNLLLGDEYQPLLRVVPCDLSLSLGSTP